MDQKESSLQELPCALSEQTFRLCSPAPATAVERLDATELGDIAEAFGGTFQQSTRLFSWVTGATTQAEITPERIGVFEDVLGRVSYRFGSAGAHFDLCVEAAIAQRAGLGSAGRDPVTIRRHRNRLLRMCDYPVQRFEDRVGPALSVPLTPAEVARVTGFSDASVFVGIERLGAIVDLHPILDHSRLKAVDEPAALIPDLLAAAEAALSLTERGRAFVATRHVDDRLRIIPGFWAAVER